MSEPTLKSHKWWLFCRIYAPLGMAAWLIIPAIWSSARTDWLQGGYHLLLAFVLAVISFPMLSTLVFFRFNYSCFGRYKRTPWPAEEPILVEKTATGSVGVLDAGGWCTPGVYVWALYPSGLGIRVPYFGKGFIPLDAIQEVRRPSWGFRTTLIHNSPEVRSRISIPSKRIVEGIRRLLAKRRNERGQEANPWIADGGRGVSWTQ